MRIDRNVALAISPFVLLACLPLLAAGSRSVLVIGCIFTFAAGVTAAVLVKGWLRILPAAVLFILGIAILAIPLLNSVRYSLGPPVPDKSVYDSTGSQQIAAGSIETKNALDQQLLSLNLPSIGLTVAAQSYADICYQGTDDANLAIVRDYYKACYGRSMLFLGSKDSSNATHSKFVTLLSESNWLSATPKSSNTAACYSDNLHALGQEGYYRDYQVYQLGYICEESDTTSQTYNFLDPGETGDNLAQSKLTTLVDESALVRQLQAQGYQTLVKLSNEKEYYRQIFQ